MPSSHFWSRVVLQRLHRWGYRLWRWTDEKMPDDELRRG